MGKYRTVDEKMKILNRYLKGERVAKLENEYGLSPNYLYKWIKKYNENGKKGLESQTGKHSATSKNMGIHLRKPKNKIDELELKLMKKDIEIARLKKGYIVKGVDQEKEFVTTFNKNTK